MLEYMRIFRERRVRRKPAVPCKKKRAQLNPAGLGFKEWGLAYGTGCILLSVFLASWLCSLATSHRRSGDCAINQTFLKKV